MFLRVVYSLRKLTPLMILSTFFFGIGFNQALSKVCLSSLPGAHPSKRVFKGPVGTPPERVSPSKFTTRHVLFQTTRSLSQANGLPRDKWAVESNEPMYQLVGIKRKNTKIDNYFSNDVQNQTVAGCAVVVLPSGRKRGAFTTGREPRFPPKTSLGTEAWRIEVAAFKLFSSGTQLERLVTRYSRRRSLPTLVYVHGHNNTMDDSMRHISQLAEDVSFQGFIVLFSWPASGALTYGQTVQNASKSALPLAGMINAVAIVGRTPTHLIAHSHGVNPILSAFRLIKATEIISKQRVDMSNIKSIVLAHGDMKVSDFREVYLPSIAGLNGKLYNFSSPFDVVLKMRRTTTVLDGLLIGEVDQLSPEICTIVLPSSHTAFTSTSEGLDSLSNILSGSVSAARVMPCN